VNKPELIKLAAESYEAYLRAKYVRPDPALAELCKENMQIAERLLEGDSRRETPKG